MKPSHLTLVSALLMLASCDTRQEQAQQLTATASALFNSGRFYDARTIILKAIGKRDDSTDEWLLLARTELQLGHVPEALTAYSRLLELDATNVEALQYVAELSFQVGQYREAVAAADRVLSLAPTATRPLLVKGLVALDQRHLPDALKNAEAILKLNPNDEYGTVLKARVLAIAHDYAGAVKMIEEHTLPTQRTDASLSTLIEIYRKMGDGKQLIATMAKLAAKRPTDANLSLDYAQTLYRIGDARTARAVLATLIEQHPNDVTLIPTIAHIWVERDPGALSADEVARLSTNRTVTQRIGLATYLIGTGRAVEAEAVLLPVEQTKLTNGPSAEARAIYASLLLDKGDSSGAKAIIDDVLASDTDNRDALLLRARMAQKVGDLTAALNDTQIVVREYPQEERGYSALATLFIAKKDPQRARQIYEDAIRTLPQNIRLTQEYSAFLYKLGDKDRAMDVARSFTLKNPSSVAGWALLERVCGQAANLACQHAAAAGQNDAAASFVPDERPGQSRSRGLFGKL